jgi:hypothetical protein
LLNVVARKIVEVTNFGVARKIIGTEPSEDISWRDGEQDTRDSYKVNNISLVNVKEQ